MDNTFLTWDYLASYAGMVFAVTIFTQFFKDLPLIKKIPTKYFAFVISLIIMTSVSLYQGTFNINNILLVILNSMLVTFTATGTKDFGVNLEKK